MTKREITSLVLKLIGIYCLAQYVPFLILMSLSAIQGSPQSSMYPAFLGVMGVVSVAVIGVYILIIRQSDAIARRLVPESADTRIDTGLDRDTIALIAFASIGLLILSGGIYGLASLCANVVVLKAHGLSSSLYGNLVGKVVQIAIVLFLFLRADGLVGLWHRLRTAGAMPES